MIEGILIGFIGAVSAAALGFLATAVYTRYRSKAYIKNILEGVEPGGITLGGGDVELFGVIIKNGGGTEVVVRSVELILAWYVSEEYDNRGINISYHRLMPSFLVKNITGQHYRGAPITGGAHESHRGFIEFEPSSRSLLYDEEKCKIKTDTVDAFVKLQQHTFSTWFLSDGFLRREKLRYEKGGYDTTIVDLKVTLEIKDFFGRVIVEELYYPKKRLNELIGNCEQWVLRRNEFLPNYKALQDQLLF